VVNNGTGDPYVVWALSSTPGVAPVNVSSSSPNNWGLGSAVMMVPAFSPDGTKLVFIDGDASGGAGWRKGLSLFDFNQAGKAFSNRRSIRNTFPVGDVMKWPTFESDSRSVVFQTSTPTELCTTCDGKNRRSLWQHGADQLLRNAGHPLVDRLGRKLRRGGAHQLEHR